MSRSKRLGALICMPSLELTTGKEQCPNSAKHTPMPEGYLDRAEWAEKKLRTHEQVQCKGCNRWAIWKRRPKQAK